MWIDGAAMGFRIFPNMSTSTTTVPSCSNPYLGPKAGYLVTALMHLSGTLCYNPSMWKVEWSSFQAHLSGAASLSTSALRKEESTWASPR